MPRRQSAQGDPTSTDSSAATKATRTKRPLPTIRFIPHIEQRSPRPSLTFTTIEKTLTAHSNIVRVGRYSERDNAAPEPNTLPVGFKSKVVSRRHCELWCTNGQWYIRDVRSSSGTFLNHVRLSPPGQESRPFSVNDGDVVQLGIDFKGGEEAIYRCVKIRIECNRDWQKSLNAYNTTAHKRLLQNAGVAKRNRDSDAASVNSSSECSICLNAVQPLQALFVAPCSHVWHYKCVRDLVHGPGYPNFLCPNCRFVANLEADVEPLEEEEVEGDGEVEGTGGLDSIDAVLRDGGGSGDGEERNPFEDDDEAAQELQHTPRASRNVGDDTDLDSEDHLTGLLSRTSLHASSSNTDNDDDDEHPPAAPSSASSQPVPIAQASSAQRSRTPSSDLLGARSATPTSDAQFALAAGMSMGDGPMTPRNDAGPFVLDGSGGSERGGPIDAVVRHDGGP